MWKYSASVSNQIQSTRKWYRCILSLNLEKVPLLIEKQLLAIKQEWRCWLQLQVISISISSAPEAFCFRSLERLIWSGTWAKVPLAPPTASTGCEVATRPPVWRQGVRWLPAEGPWKHRFTGDLEKRQSIWGQGGKKKINKKSPGSPAHFTSLGRWRLEFVCLQISACSWRGLAAKTQFLSLFIQLNLFPFCCQDWLREKKKTNPSSVSNIYWSRACLCGAALRSAARV